VLLPGDGTAEVVERGDPEPGQGEVVVAMRASAICRSDMSLYRWSPIVGGAREPGKVVPGHEAAGEVVAVGPGVEGLRPRSRVAGYLAVGCGHCCHCFSGYWMLCKTWKCMGFDFDGGDAELFKLPEKACLPLPDQLSYVAGSVLTDMFGSQFHLQRELGVNPAATIVIFGLGPMGCAGAMVGHALGATVIGVDPVRQRQRHAEELGADVVLGPEEFERQRQKGWLDEGADVAIDCSGSEQGQNAALNCVRARGDVAFVGERTETTIDPSNQIIRKLARVHGGWYFPRWRYDEMVEFVLRHSLRLEKLVGDTVDLADAPKAFAEFEARRAEKLVFIA
jgi:threonine dehydrogenase-like Zn-dependent dehydrogenase